MGVFANEMNRILANKRVTVTAGFGKATRSQNRTNLESGDILIMPTFKILPSFTCPKTGKTFKDALLMQYPGEDLTLAVTERPSEINHRAVTIKSMLIKVMRGDKELYTEIHPSLISKVVYEAVEDTDGLYVRGDAHYCHGTASDDIMSEISLDDCFLKWSDKKIVVHIDTIKPCAPFGVRRGDTFEVSDKSEDHVYQLDYVI